MPLKDALLLLRTSFAFSVDLGKFDFTFASEYCLILQ